MNLRALCNSRGTQSGFPASNGGASDGDRKEQIRLTNVVVIEEICDGGAEGISVEGPPAVRDGNAKLVLFVALAVQGNESRIVGPGKLKQRARGGDQRRGLIIMTVESAECPLKMWNCERRSEARADRSFRLTTRKTSWTNSRTQGQPRRNLQFIVEER